MSTIEEPLGLRVGLDSAGVLMTPGEFDAIEDYDEEFQYELVHGVLVVTPFATITRSSCGPIESGNSSLSDSRCVCISTMPGTKYFPVPSIRTASLGNFTFFALPISTISPFLTITVWFANTRSRSIGITLTFVKATVCAETDAASAAKRKMKAKQSLFISSFQSKLSCKSASGAVFVSITGRREAEFAFEGAVEGCFGFVTDVFGDLRDAA